MRASIIYFLGFALFAGAPHADTPSTDQEELSEQPAPVPKQEKAKKDAKKAKPKDADGADTRSEEPHELEEVVVESEPLERTIGSLARPVTVLKDAELRQQMAPTIGSALSQQPGINNQSFGPGVGQPVIRGLSGPRVRIMENGIGNNDVSNISPDHANSIEPSQAERIEVLRGPSTLLYGSGAIGGVVNVIDNRVPDKKADKPIGGAFNQIYNSALDETSSSLKLEGGESQFAYHLDGFYRNSGNEIIGGDAIDVNAARAYDPALAEEPYLVNTNGYVPNTNARAKGGTVGASWVDDIGYAGAAINTLENNYGIPPIGVPDAPSIRINLQQTKYDFRGGIDKPFAFVEKLKAKFGYTDYQHTEFEGGDVGTIWRSDTYEGRLELNHEPLGPFKGQWGFQSVNGTTSATGDEATLPVTDIANYGVFAVETLETDPLIYDFGFRIEPQSVSPAASSGYAARSFLPISGSVSGLWKIDPANNLSLAFTESQRGPQAQELYVNGVHHATRSYEIGNPDLNMETSFNLELGYTFKKDWVNAQFNLFNNWINDYIYAQYTGEVYGHEEHGHEEEQDHEDGHDHDHEEEHGGHEHGELPILQIEQANAIFKGFEANVMFPVMENSYGLVDLTLFGDYTRGQLINAGNGNVPFMPPLRFGAQLDYAKNKWSTFFRVTRGEAQDYAAENETDTPGWVLMNVGVQYEAKTYADSKLLFYLKGNNLLDQNIRNSTSYLKNFAPEPGRGVQLGFQISY
jgi:iron complex outermembrane receptor protein